MSWVRRSTLAFAVLAYLLVAVLTPFAERRLFGARPGVSVAGVQVGGWLPRRVNQLLHHLALAVDRPARPAVLNKVTGAIVPGRSGVFLDVPATARAVRHAAAGSDVRPVLRIIRPPVTARMLRGRARVAARVPAPPGAVAVDNVVVLPEHPLVFVSSCSVVAALIAAAGQAGLPARRLRPDCRVELRNDTPAPLVLRVRDGRLEILRYPA